MRQRPADLDMMTALPLRRGRLFYVMGPSGAGKDSLLAHARAAMPDAVPVVFAHRYITRSGTAGGENHVALSPQEFALRAAHGCFCMAWDSHGHRYGIGIEVEAWRERGLSVVVNGSRAWFPTAAERFPDIIPIAVTVDPAALRTRLERRGRETSAEIEERLTRAAAFTVAHPALITIDNSGPLEVAGAAFVNVLTRD
ncbi:MAG: phosphonate metabolism protein/1,5-bisphosphokinase (PRPP-forming) PhnN [Rhodospirillaceae bacterium]